MADTTAEVIELFNKDNMTVEECLQLCTRNSGDYQQLIVIGWDKTGEFFHHSSDLNKADANWLLDAAKQEILNGDAGMTAFYNGEPA